jgi:SAM-dependent methyltransferase
MPSVGAALGSEPMPPVRSLVGLSGQSTQDIGLRCPACKTDLTALPYQSLAQPAEAIRCVRCFAKLAPEHGIWLALSQDRQEYFARFIHDYESIRKAEGRGSDDPAFYRSLPFRDCTGRNSRQWAIRARTYKYIASKMLPDIATGTSGPLRILDLGAGNGWFSYRLASLGHLPVAVDLQTNSFDGLGAADHYEHLLATLFPRFQADVDHLPFTDDQFDCAIFNASFHYSENYDRTLAEVIRCLRPAGIVVIADSPSYSREQFGLLMVEERRKTFEKSFGFTSDSLHSREYLTGDRLLYLESRHDLMWTTYRPWYGFRWASRPMLAWIQRRREPSQFRIYSARVKIA